MQEFLEDYLYIQKPVLVKGALVGMCISSECRCVTCLTGNEWDELRARSDSVVSCDGI